MICDAWTTYCSEEWQWDVLFPLQDELDLPVQLQTIVDILKLREWVVAVTEKSIFQSNIVKCIAFNSCVSFFSVFLVESSFRYIKYIPKWHTCIDKNKNIQEYANSNSHQLVEIKLFSAIYRTCQIYYVFSKCWQGNTTIHVTILFHVTIPISSQCCCIMFIFQGSAICRIM